MSAIPAFLSVTLPKFDLFGAIKHRYKHAIEEQQFNYLFENRNKPEALKPFLDSLGARYLMIVPELIIIETSVETESKLEALGFANTESVCPQTKRFKQILKHTKDLFLIRLYQVEYNFEIYLIDMHDWDRLMLTREIVDNLKIDERKYFDSFVKVYRTMSTHKT